MPLYEYRKNAANRVVVPGEVRQDVVCGTAKVLDSIIDMVRKRKQPGQAVTVAIDGWYGVDWEEMKARLHKSAARHGLSLELISSAQLFQPAARIEEYRRPFVTDDPSFGWVNDQGKLEDIMDPAKTGDIKDHLAAKSSIKADALVVAGSRRRHRRIGNALRSAVLRRLHHAAAFVADVG